LRAAAYFPDPGEPIDRWFQAENAGNPRTTAKFITGLCRERSEFVIDPFCGSGSTATAARLLSLPFYGIEADPVLTCASLAKAWAAKRHAALLPVVPDARVPGELATALDRVRNSRDPEDALTVSALMVLSAFRGTQQRPLEADTITADLSAWPDPVPGGCLTRGDALSRASWTRLGLPRTRAVMYASPPFGLTSPAIHSPDDVRAAAVSVLEAFRADTLGRAITGFPGYAAIVVGMFRRAAEYLARGTLIVEHEPDDSGADGTTAVIRAVDAEFNGVIHSPRIIQCGAFSRRGTLSLMIFELR
jgi:hypothetical protein